MDSDEKLLWAPDQQRIERSRIFAFQRQVEQQHDVSFANYSDLHQWSIDQPEKFWTAVWDFTEVVASHRGDTVVENFELMPGANWFPQARLNFAENLLRQSGPTDALVFRSEDAFTRHMSWDQLRSQTAAVAAHLRSLGVKTGDRVVGFMPNMPETIVAMLAASSIGATWSSCSPDFGVQGVIDRFGQIEPVVLFSATGYRYSGKFHDSLQKVAEIIERLPSLRQTIVVGFEQPEELFDVTLANAHCYAQVLNSHTGAALVFEQLPFNHPLYVMYSSGTTGVPKCIIHSSGGSLLQHLKEHQLHCDVDADDKLFYFTTCGWMMWNWLVTGLASGATVLLYDGSPFHPDSNLVFDFADEQGMTILGTSAKYIDALAKSGVAPMHTHSLKTVRALLSTGSPLVPESFDYVYRNIKSDICLSSVSGGTDLLACFAGGNPTLPVYRGELQCLMLGMATDVFDDAGNSVRNQKGELVCTRSFPSMPIGFWNDADGQKYHNAYFDRFENLWCHGDFVEINDRGGMTIFGRSDAVLNPGGVRIGTAEIYRQVETLEDVVEGLVIGQNWQNDVRVVLFVKLREGLRLDAALQDKIKRQIRANATPRHVPAKVVQVADIPRTKSGKIVELAVRSVVHGEDIRNREAMANPEALDYFRDLAELSAD